MAELPPYCDPFDQALAERGPPAVFTVDADGQWRLDADRTRDAWSRLTGPCALAPVLALLRDRATGYVQLVQAGSAALLIGHPRADVACYADPAEALAVLASLGRPPIWRGDWPLEAGPLSATPPPRPPA